MSGREKRPSKDDTATTMTTRGSRARAKMSPSRSTNDTPKEKTANKRTASKSPSRRKGETPTKRTPRKATPTRSSPSRSKRSPGRLSKSSPSRMKANERIAPVIDVDTDSDVDVKPKFEIRGRSSTKPSRSPPIKITEDEIKVAEVKLTNLRTVPVRRVTRSSVSQETERIVHLKEDFLMKQTKLTEFSDEDEMLLTKKIDCEPPVYRFDPNFKPEFCGWLGSLFFIFFIPSLTLLTQINYKDIEHTESLKIYQQISTYIDLYSFVGFGCFLLVNILTSLIPFGGSRPSGQLECVKTSRYISNGWISLIVTYGILVALQYYDVNVFDYVYDHFFHLTVCGILYATIFSLVLYYKSFYVDVADLNSEGDTNSGIYNFFIGKEVAPSLIGVHTKVYLLRITQIGKSIIITSILMKSLNVSDHYIRYTSLTSDLKLLNYDYTVIAVCGMLYVQLFDKLIFERMWASTYELRREGHGYFVNVYYLASIFWYGMVVKHVYDDNVQMDRRILAGVVAIFFVGTVLSRLSSNKKNSFKENPFNPLVANLEMIPASHGRKILSGGYWGVVRHPNYLGEILTHVALAVFVWDSPALISILFVIAMLIYRLKRVEHKAKKKYNVAWDRYCQRVRYALIPKIF